MATGLNPLVETTVTRVFLGQRKGQSSAPQPTLEPKSPGSHSEGQGALRSCISLKAPVMLMSLAHGHTVSSERREDPKASGWREAPSAGSPSPLGPKRVSAVQSGQAAWPVLHTRQEQSQAGGPPPHHAAGDPPFLTGQELFSDFGPIPKSTLHCAWPGLPL